MKRVGLTIWLLLLTVSTNLYDVEGRSTGPPAGEQSNFDLVFNQMTPSPNSNESTKGADASVYVYCSTKLTKRD